MIRELLEPGESLADASTWADEHNREIPGSASWHFVNVPIWAQQYDPRDCRPQGCVVSKIAEFKAILLDHNAPLSRRRTALRFLVHLVQDLHQPMPRSRPKRPWRQCLQLRYGRYDNTNLHQVWDSGLLHPGVPQRRRADARTWRRSQNSPRRRLVQRTHRRLGQRELARRPQRLSHTRIPDDAPIRRFDR